jgi:uncharacterized protein YndB with AHSA1/START domain
MKESRPIIVEQYFDKPVNIMWEAITDERQMRKWFFENIPSFQPVAGFETEFNVVSGERNFLHQWKVTEVVPEKKITVNWKYPDYPGNADVSFELFPEGKGTRLVLTNTGQESFPADIPEFRRESCEGGWNYFIRQRLVEYAAKNL